MNYIYLKLLGASIMVTIVISLFSAISVILQAGDLGFVVFQIIAFLLLATSLICYMKKKDPTLHVFGFKQTKIDPKLYGFIALIVVIQPLILGIDISISPLIFLLTIIQMILVGLVEESLFRSIFFYYLKGKGTSIYILFSSFVFGLLHIASGLNPETSLFLVCLQVINALMLGAVFSFMYYITKSIYLLIGFHALFNIFASCSQIGSPQRQALSILILIACYIIFLKKYASKLGRT